MPCWFPNGDPIAEDIPCNGTSGVGACCGPEFNCYENGMCKNKDPSKGQALAREDRNGPGIIQSCGGTDYCCTHNFTFPIPCCASAGSMFSASVGVILSTQIAASTTKSSSTASSTTSALSSTTSSLTSSPTGSNAAVSSHNTLPVKLGVGFGVPLGLLLLASLACLGWTYTRYKKQAASARGKSGDIQPSYGIQH
ncbi:MAG: hypothetical protein M1836_005045 [Candelina mexicana]|nr:MAG: hypothetical protein M1836_005045 [Candelina mexicana]